MNTSTLKTSGFVEQYLVSGPKEEPFINHDTDENQLRYETHLRSILPEHPEQRPEGEIRLGEASSLGKPWNYYYNYGNWFVDLSTFYSTLTRVDVDACTQLSVQEDMDVPAVLWSYAALDVWCNDDHVGRIEHPVYKPIQQKKVIFRLKKGHNLVYIRLQTLGVRDTRTLFGIQLTEHADRVQISLPDEIHTIPAMECGEWISEAYLRDGVLHLPSAAPEHTVVGYDSMTPDFGRAESKVRRCDISGRQQVPLDQGEAYILLECSVGSQRISRSMEDISRILPKRLEGLNYEENKQEIFRRTAAVESLSRGGKFGFAISNILARKAVGKETGRDKELFLETLTQIENRYDCSDFLMCGLIRYLKNYPIEDELEHRVKDVLLNYRYWMDQEGSDAMCFWSENHSLMFYVSAMNAGELYPEEWFVRAGMTGRQLYEAGKKRIGQWLDDVETHGFEEFLSTVYMCVTFAGLLNVVDYTTKEISQRAALVTDRMLSMLALHTFKGSIIAPMGRVYRQVIYPFLQGAQALMNLVNPQVPYSYGEGWLAFYATSSYRIPSGLIQMMEYDVTTEYATGNAYIKLEKNRDYCLTAVQSPRIDLGFKRWNNLTLEEDSTEGNMGRVDHTVVDRGTHEYTKSLNERFHGTTCFEPGTYGYQQHLWSAALDGEVHVFANHPGGTCDSSQMRPGYWYGNGVIPAIRQEKGLIFAVYEIPKAHPIHFTHVFWPGVKFDETIAESNWLYGRKDQGYLAIWCSEELVPHQDQLFDCEYRSYGDHISYLCICAGETDCDGMEEFLAHCRLKLESVKHQFPVYEAAEDKTQYI